MTAIGSSSSMAKPLLRATGVVLLTAMAFLLPRLLGGTSIAYSTLTTIAIFAVMCYGVDIVLSYLGEVSLGHTLFWAAGGYAAANLSVKYGLNGWATALATIAICTAALDTDDAADEIIVWLMRAYAQEGRMAELEHIYRRYARALRIDLDDLIDHQDPVVQVYQSLGKSRMMNNSSS